MFKSTFLRNALIIAIIFGLQFSISAQAISDGIEVKTENLPIVLIQEEIEVNVAERQISPASSKSAQLYFTIDSANDVIEENGFLSTIFEQINKQRLDNSLSVLTLNSKLNNAAELKAQDMVQNNYFAHNSPDNITPWHWFNESGYIFLFAGENLAVDFDFPEEMVQAWMNSPSHRQNILDSRFNETGLAIIEGNYNGHSSLFVVQMFGQQQIRANNFIDVDIMMSSIEQSVNLVNAVVNYPSDKLVLNTIDFDDSAFSLFLKEPDLGEGIVTISAIQPFPGIKGIVKVAHLQFKVLSKGDINLNWNNDSVVLANDGFGTDILEDAIDIHYLIE